MSQPTPNSMTPDPVPPTPNPPTMGTRTPSPSTASLVAPPGPILTEQQMMGHYALIAMGVKVATIKKLESEELDEFSNLLIVSKETLEELKSKGIINAINRDAILKFQSWHNKYLSFGNNQLTTKQELSAVFDTALLNDFMSQSSEASQSSQIMPNAISTAPIDSSTKQGNTINSNSTKPLDLSKFPSWNGRKDTWDTFHVKLKAILLMNKLRRLLEFSNKNSDDSEQLYHILAHCMVNGLMKNTVL